MRVEKQAVVALALVCGALLARAEDRTIDFGSDPVTLTADASYGRLVVNGDLTVSAGLQLTVETLCVASNITGTANLVLEEGATLTVADEGAFACVIGIDGGRANVTLASGSHFSSPRIQLGLGYASGRTVEAGAQATFASVAVNGAVFEATEDESGLTMQNSSYDVWPKNTAASTSTSEIVLNRGGELRLKKISFCPARPADVIFNGGKLKAIGCPWKKSLVAVTWMNSSRSLRFISRDANPIDIYLWDNHSSLLSGGSDGSSLEFSGDGDVIVDGKSVVGGSNLTARSLVSKGIIYWRNAGKIIIRDKIVQLNGKERFNDERGNCKTSALAA